MPRLRSTLIEEMDCAVFQDAATELALGILTGPDRRLP
jgi:hypothetical protein